MLAEQVAVFYPDLMDERFESAFALYHQRYSTNTFPHGGWHNRSACWRTTVKSTR